MPVGYILSQAGKKMGLTNWEYIPGGPQTNDRLILLRYLNEAARELYDQSDMIGILMEQVFKVNGDQTISLPYYVGPVRAARNIFFGHHTWHLNQMRPRYNQINWKDMWSNLRIRNTQALMATVTNASVGVLTTPIVEDPPVSVIVVGPTVGANGNILSSNGQETVVMSSTSARTQNCYADYVTVVKPNGVNAYDITLSDVDGNIFTVIPNCMREARYQILDVSMFPFLPGSNSDPLQNYLEILYKKALLELSLDSDTFPSKTDYDDILVNKMMQLSNEEQNKSDIALAYDSKATRSLSRKQEDQNRATEDEIALVRNPHDRIHTRVSGSRRFYQGWWGWGGR
jgi:hypothetical protein